VLVRNATHLSKCHIFTNPVDGEAFMCRQAVATDASPTHRLQWNTLSGVNSAQSDCLPASNWRTRTKRYAFRDWTLLLRTLAVVFLLLTVMQTPKRKKSDSFYGLRSFLRN
jgi:hypothetical protein